MANTIEDMINDIVHEQVDQVIDEKVEDHHKIEDLESRVASLEDADMLASCPGTPSL